MTEWSQWPPTEEGLYWTWHENAVRPFAMEIVERFGKLYEPISGSLASDFERSYFIGPLPMPEPPETTNV